MELAPGFFSFDSVAHLFGWLRLNGAGFRYEFGMGWFGMRDEIRCKWLWGWEMKDFDFLKWFWGWRLGCRATAPLQSRLG
jgi:hypothetical protein